MLCLLAALLSGLAAAGAVSVPATSQRDIGRLDPPPTGELCRL
jgi:hypothetical protein